MLSFCPNVRSSPFLQLRVPTLGSSVYGKESVVTKQQRGTYVPVGIPASTFDDQVFQVVTRLALSICLSRPFQIYDINIKRDCSFIVFIDICNIQHWANARVTCGNHSCRSKLPIFRLKYERTFAVYNYENNRAQCLSCLLYVASKLSYEINSQNPLPNYSCSQKDCGNH